MSTKPNIIFIYADDLGRGLLSCYGQKKYKTPNIDRLANQGLRFTSSYGCALCAPARASMITGIHDCHAGRWGYTEGQIYQRLGEDLTLEEIYELINSTAFQNLEETEFLPHILKKGGYYTGQIGKLEWGFATTEKDIRSHGWDYHYGYYDHHRCHGYYPPFLFENGNVVTIEGNTRSDCGVSPRSYETVENCKERHNMEGKVQYSQDLFNAKIMDFIDEHKNEPFFLYHPSQLPHGLVAVPEMHEKAKDIEGVSEFEKEYASMVLRLDDTVGMIYEKLEKENLLDNTIVMFSADNGHCAYYNEIGHMDSKFDAKAGRAIDDIDYCYTSERANDVFDGNSGLKGKKRSNNEGGVKVPFIAYWKNHTPVGQTTDHLIANYDLLATFAQLVNVAVPRDKDSISFLDILEGKEAKECHDYVIYASHIGPGITTKEGYKLRYIIDAERFELYNLKEDYAEVHNLADQMLDKTRELAKILLRECDGNFINGAPFAHQVKRIIM